MDRPPARLAAYRVILWIALAAYPLLLQGMHAATEFPSPLLVRCLGYLGLAATCLPVAMALLCLHELTNASLPDRVRRDVGREAVLGAVSAALFNLVNLLPLRDGVWWLLLGLIFLMRFLPVRAREYPSEIRTRWIHIFAGVPVLVYAVVHVANHLVALYSFAASDAMMTAIRQFLRIPAVEIFLLAAVAVQIATGVSLLAGSRMLERSEFLRDVQILSGAYLSVFLCAHVVNTVLVERILHGVNPMFSGMTGNGVYGVLSTANNSRLMPYYVLSVAATFVHIGASGRWLLIPQLGATGSARFAHATMWFGVAAAFAVALPMMQVHLGK